MCFTFPGRQTDHGDEDEKHEDIHLFEQIARTLYTIFSNAELLYFEIAILSVIISMKPGALLYHFETDVKMKTYINFVRVSSEPRSIFKTSVFIRK